MKKSIKFTISIVATVLLSYGVIYAWNGLTASPGDTLDSLKWNELVTKVQNISTDSGNVGIGTSTPNNPLDVIGTTSTNVIQVQSTNPNGRSSIDYVDDTGSFSMSMGVANSAQSIAGQSYIHTHGSHPLILGSSGEAMRIVPGNNIGMGVVDPKAKLDINGGVKISGSLCDIDHVGTIQYDTSTDSFQGCRNNTGSPTWVNLH